MRTTIGAFALGIWLCQRLPALPAIAWLAGGTVAWGAAGVLAVRYCARPRSRWLAAAALALCAGMLWGAWRAQWRLADELPPAWEGRDVAVTGVVAALPQALTRGERFVFRVETAAGPVPSCILLSWYAPRRGGAPPAVHAGQRWRLTVRLKRPHGFANPHGFDYEAWLLERGVRATGYVREDEGNRLLTPFVVRPMLAVHRLREAVRERFAAGLGGTAEAGVLVALAVGDQSAIPPAQWEVFRRTGVAHLVAISGLHIALVAMLAGGLAGALWRRFPFLLLRWPARRAAAVAGLAAATAYALLAGLGLPTQRALIMLAVAALGMVSGRETAPSRVLALALLTVLLADPWAVLAAGFWLSFGAVGAILFVLGGRVAAPRGWRAGVRIQLAVTLATLPALLILFHAFSLISPLANAFAIPLVSFLIVPLTLLAALVPLPALLALAHWLVGLMVAALSWLAALPAAYWQQAAPPAWLALAGVAAASWLLLPRATPARWAGGAALLPLLAWSPPRPASGAFVMTVLDVGQGLAVHVQTASHDLLYDAGPRYGPDADAGDRVLVPYLAASGLTGVDRLVVSHDDVDHAGGALSLWRGVAVAGVLSSLPASHPLLAAAGARADACRAGQRWRWDGVAFEVLHPVEAPGSADKDNNRSCVLRVAGAGGSVLLTGDIEVSAEAALLQRMGDGLQSSVIVVAHHGSRSSSSPAWVQAVRPETAIFAVGYRNPFHHPNAAVWARWRDAGARGWRTDLQGAVRVEVGAGGVAVSAQRERERRYWYGR